MHEEEPNNEFPNYAGSVAEKLIASGLSINHWEKYYDDDGNEFYHNHVNP